jgi:hypothetical protein
LPLWSMMRRIAWFGGVGPALPRPA